MIEKKYTSDGYLIVSELNKCSHFEKDEKAMLCCGNVDCFYCKYSDFRKIEFIKRQEEDPQKGILYSVCHNEKNKKTAL